MKSVCYEADKYEGSFHCRVGGPEDAPALVMLHGHMAHSIAYRRVWRRLAKSFRVIVPDLPGHGYDETFRGLQMQPRIETLADWLFDLIDRSAEAPVHLVGHSLGASIAYEAGKESPSRFCSLTLVSPGFCISVPPGAATFFDYLPPSLARMAMNRTGMRIIEPFRWQGEPLDAEEREAYVEPLKNLDRLEFTLRLGAEIVRGACDLDELEPLGVPTQVIFGEGDDFVRVDAADEIGQRLHASKVEVFSDSGHSPPEDSPLQFGDALLDFIETGARCGQPA
ncbi:alpha/beta hydrolase [Persicimonas caeni]|uniref:Alpha/beta hydrolase n=1 Tax=Persicimonas caeni TaxID=2292766 RepID=A0A4Y6PPE7_PERCE|nr:alpha/beta hydrolase [Persicimonas caeni]QDG50212.1 alpha/beta hydrolase [Persicimonas caeni]QED31433.1 alpha/beta hydrolase [Persicimonas caeni]